MISALALLVAGTFAPDKPWTLAAGGDIMLNGISPAVRPLDGVREQFLSASVAYANLEIPLTRSTRRTPHKSARDIRRRAQFVLKADPKHIDALSRIGLDLVSLGNNHAMDYGPLGLKEMTELLRRKSIAFAGAGMNEEEAVRPALVSRPSAPRVAMLSYLAFMGDGALNACWPAKSNSPGVAVLRFGGRVDERAQQTLRRHIAQARRMADVVLVAPHWGLEKQTLPTPYQIALGRAMVDAGADIVIGNHPHVLQGGEIYRGKPILYSLGNLVSPLPGRTAVFVLRWRGTKFERLDVFPARIGGGRVNVTSQNDTLFSELSRRLARRYPHRESRPLPAGNVARVGR